MYMKACYTKSDKISAYGIRGPVLLWIKDFHTGRRQYVSIKGETSSWKDVLSGVPQGSVLNPMLFVTYINDLPEVVPSVVKIFADDTKLCNTDINNDIILQDLDALSSWANLWINVKRFIKGTTTQDYQYTMNFEDIDSSSEEKDLGVIFQQDLKFSNHISTKINQSVYLQILTISKFFMKI